MKTPEQMAEEYCEDHDECEFAREAFLAGYQAAKDEYKVAIDTYNDVAKQMLEEAVRIMSPKDQLADADKVMNFSNNSNGWISVKERLPEFKENAYTKDVLIAFYDGTMAVLPFQRRDGSIKTGHFDSITTVAGWMPLPELPKGEE